MMKIKHRRTRYQQGSLTIESRKNGPDVWAYLWRESNSNGSRTQRKRIIGTKLEYPTKTAAWKAVEALQLDINAESATTSLLTVDQVIEHYKVTELADANSKTKEVYRYQLDKVISPKWGTYRLSDVKPIAVERWLGDMQAAPRHKSQNQGSDERPVSTCHAV
jgi:integrase